MKSSLLNKKQPRALSLLFFSELWERFGFYTVQALMVLYLTNAMHFSDEKAYDVSGAFSALLYAAPLIGGWLADRIVGFQRAITVGFILYMVGYFLMDSHAQMAFYFAMALVIAGNGYFKANVSSLLGTIYEDNDPRRDRGFTIFYMGINIGSLLGPISASIIQVHYGYHPAFAMCGIGLLIGFVAYISLRKRLLKHHGLDPQGAISSNPATLKRSRIATYLATLILAGIVSFILPYPIITDWSLGILSVASIVYALYETFGLANFDDKKKMIALIILIAYSVIFWAYYMQSFFSLTLFTERNIDRHVLGYTLPTALFATIPNIFLVILAPFFVKLWSALDKKRKNPSIGMKFTLSMVFTAISFLALNLGDSLNVATGIVPLFWLLLAGFIREIGELFISPIGLSAVTRLAPPKLTGAMMGLWFLAIGGALAVGGRMADIADVPEHVRNPIQTLPIYNHAFWVYTLSAAAIAIVSFLLLPFFNRLAGEKMFN